jgi:hypothetical protein
LWTKNIVFTPGLPRTPPNEIYHIWGPKRNGQQTLKLSMKKNKISQISFSPLDLSYMQRTLLWSCRVPKIESFNSCPYNKVSSFQPQIDLVTTQQQISWLKHNPPFNHLTNPKALNHLLSFSYFAKFSGVTHSPSFILLNYYKDPLPLSINYILA